MNHEEEFLQQIVAAPEDVEPRLVYADWLEERGDPRGDFIRIQCELAEIDPYAAMSSEEEYDRRDELLERESDLRLANEERWTATLKDYVRAVQFRRGMIEYIEADAEAIIEHGPKIFEQAPILLMTVTQSRRHLKALVDLQGVQRLRGLALDGSFLQQQDLKEVVRLLSCKHLHGLSMSRCALDSGALAPFTNLVASELQQLDLSSNRLRNPGAVILAECRGLPRLEVLNLAHNEIRFNGAKALKNSNELQSLRQIVVKGNPMEQRAIDTLRSRYDHIVI